MPPLPPSLAGPPAETTVRGGTENILLVEDDVAVRLLARRILEVHGYHVWEAASGREALEIWRSMTDKIHLLLTDVVMPDGVTGRELAEQLCVRAPALKVVYTSGYSQDVLGNDTSFLRRNKHNFLRKPCASDVLLNTVRRCLDGTLEPGIASQSEKVRDHPPAGAAEAGQVAGDRQP